MKAYSLIFKWIKITAGLLEEFQSFDQVIAFNNNIIAEVTDHYLPTAKALRDNQQKRFQEDYKKWFLETQVGKEYPMGPPKPKKTRRTAYATTASCARRNS